MSFRQRVVLPEPEGADITKSLPFLATLLTSLFNALGKSLRLNTGKKYMPAISNHYGPGAPAIGYIDQPVILPCFLP
jgi:hypothetical protein